MPDLYRLVHEVERGQRVVQPRLRHRFQVDRHGLARSTHRLTGAGEAISFHFEDNGSPLQQILGRGLRRRAPGPGCAPRDRRRAASGDCAGTARPARPSSRTWPGARAGAARCRRSSTRSPGRSKCSAFPPAPSARTSGTCSASTGPAHGGPPRPRRGRDRRQQGHRRPGRGPPDPAALMARRRTARSGVGALLLAPGAGSDREQPVARGDRGGGGAAAGRADGLPVPQAGRKAPDRPPVLLAAVRDGGGGAGRPGRHRRPPAGAGRALDGWAHVLDGRGRRPAGGRAGPHLATRSTRRGGPTQLRTEHLPSPDCSLPVHVRYQGSVRCSRRARPRPRPPSPDR